MKNYGQFILWASSSSNASKKLSVKNNGALVSAICAVLLVIIAGISLISSLISGSEAGIFQLFCFTLILVLSITIIFFATISA